MNQRVRANIVKAAVFVLAWVLIVLAAVATVRLGGKLLITGIVVIYLLAMTRVALGLGPKDFGSGSQVVSDYLTLLLGLFSPALAVLITLYGLHYPYTIPGYGPLPYEVLSEYGFTPMTYYELERPLEQTIQHPWILRLDETHYINVGNIPTPELEALAHKTRTVPAPAVWQTLFPPVFSTVLLFIFLLSPFLPPLLSFPASSAGIAALLVAFTGTAAAFMEQPLPAGIPEKITGEFIVEYWSNNMGLTYVLEYPVDKAPPLSDLPNKVQAFYVPDGEDADANSRAVWLASTKRDALVKIADEYSGATRMWAMITPWSILLLLVNLLMIPFIYFCPICNFTEEYLPPDKRFAYQSA